MCVPNFRSVGPMVQPVERKRTDTTENITPSSNVVGKNYMSHMLACVYPIKTSCTVQVPLPRLSNASIDLITASNVDSGHWLHLAFLELLDITLYFRQVFAILQYWGLEISQHLQFIVVYSPLFKLYKVFETSGPALFSRALYFCESNNNLGVNSALAAGDKAQ